MPRQDSYSTDSSMWLSDSGSPSVPSVINASASGVTPARGFGSATGGPAAPRTYGTLAEAFAAPYSRAPKEQSYDGLMQTYGQFRQDKQRHNALVAEAAAQTRIPMNPEATAKYAAVHAQRVQDRRVAAAARVEATKGRGVADPNRADPRKIGKDVIPPWVRAQHKPKGGSALK